MKRKRPRNYNYTLSDHKKLKRRWRSWLPDLSKYLSDLFRKTEIFWELQDVANENKSILNPYTFFDWMCRNYMDSVVIGIRKFIDSDTRSHSLWVMLYQVLENPGILSLDSNKISQNEIRSDLRLIEDACERLRKLANKKVAHFNSPGAIRKLPTLNEVTIALNRIDTVLCKYSNILTGSSDHTFKATPQYDWTDVLLEPWIKEGSKYYK